MKCGKQHGFSAIGLLCMSLLASFLLIVVTRIGPVYRDDFFVKVSLSALKKEPLSELSDERIKRKLVDYFSANNVRDVDARKAVVKRTKRQIIVEFNYERRVYFLFNLDVIAAFNNTYESTL